MGKRKRIPVDTKIALLTESGYKCGNPTCRFVLTLELHHIIRVSDSGSDDPSNLLPLCPNCHNMHTKGHIPLESIRAWKALLISLSNAFDRKAIDILLMLSSGNGSLEVYVSGDGLLECSSLISSGLIGVGPDINRMPNMFHAYYRLKLTEKGRRIVQGWKDGDLSVLDNIELPK